LRRDSGPLVGGRQLRKSSPLDQASGLASEVTLSNGIVQAIKGFRSNIMGCKSCLYLNRDFIKLDPSQPIYTGLGIPNSYRISVLTF